MSAAFGTAAGSSSAEERRRRRSRRKIPGCGTCDAPGRDRLARPVRHLGVELVVGHLRDLSANAASMKRVHPLDKLRRRQHRPGLLVELQKLDDLGDVLREHELVAARQDRDRARAQPPQFGAAFGVFEDIDRFELDPTDREKLLESQAAGSPRLPERLQCGGHRLLPRSVTHVRLTASSRTRQVLATCMGHRYNAPMRRLGLILAIVLLLVLFGAYTAFWFIVAGRIEGGAAQWAALGARPGHRGVVELDPRRRLPAGVSGRIARRNPA